MELSPLIGGFGQNLNKQIYWCNPNRKTILRDIELPRTETLRSLQEFSENKFDADDAFVRIIEPFISFNANTGIEVVLAKIAPNLSLSISSLQFQDFANESIVYDDLSL